MRDKLIVCYDDSDIDDTYILITKSENDNMRVIKSYKDEAAKELYKILIGE